MSPSSRVHRSGRGRSTAATVPPQRSSERSGPISAAGAEHDHDAALEAQPLGVVDDSPDGLAQAGLDDAVGDPGVELPAQVVAREAVAAVGDGEGGARPRPRRGAPRWPAGRRGCRRPRRAPPRGAPGGRRGRASTSGRRARRGRRRRWRRHPRARETGLHQAAEVGEVATAPVGLACGRRGADRVDGTQRVGDDRPPGGTGGAAAVDLGKDDAGRVTHPGSRVRTAPALPGLLGTLPPGAQPNRSQSAWYSAASVGPW